MKDQKPDGKAATLKRDITPMFDYYKAWDKFADKAEHEGDDTKAEANDGEGDIIPAKNPEPEKEKGPLS